MVRYCQDKDILSEPTQEQLRQCIGKLNECSHTLEQCTWDLQKVQDDDDSDSTDAEAHVVIKVRGSQLHLPSRLWCRYPAPSRGHSGHTTQWLK